MEDLQLLEAVEKYLRGEMSESEKKGFEALRSAHPEVDQAVVEHASFLHQLDKYGHTRNTKHLIQQVHNQLLAQGEIQDLSEPQGGATLINFWNRYKRTIAVAASIAGITALAFSAGLQLFTPKVTTGELQNLNRKVTQLERGQQAQNQKLDKLIETDPAPSTPQVSGGTGFLLDADGYLVTNYHVVVKSTNLYVYNNGLAYRATAIHTDPQKDLAILKISDEKWKATQSIPYIIRSSKADLGEEVFTLGYPRNTIVYNRGYLSAGTGFKDDSLSIQLDISANPGNSGGPIFDKSGNVVGILSNRDRQSIDVVFASRASNIISAVQDLRNDTAFKDLSLPTRQSLRNLDRVAQIKKLQDCVFMVKVY